jgi:hypothetical protein
MTVNYTTLLGLAQPVSGTESGTWGDTVNNNLTAYLDDAIAGAQIISGTLTAVTLSKTTGANLSQAGTGSTGSSQYQIIRCTGAPASLLTITAPAANKTYVVINATSTSQSVKIVGAGPTAGVTITSGKTSIVAWNGSDFVEITPSTISGTLPVANGGTGNTTGTATINANLTGAITSIGNAASLGSFTSANLAAALTDETGTGANVFATSPTLVTPVLGVATGTSFQGIIGNVTPAAGTFTTLTSTGNATLGDAEASDTHAIKGVTTLLANSASAALTVTQTGAGNAFVVEDSTSADSTPFVITADGLVVGGHTTSVPVTSGTSPRFQTQEATLIATNDILSWGNDLNAPSLKLAKAKSGVIGTYTPPANDEPNGRIRFYAADGAAFIENVRIEASVDGTPGTNDMPGRLVFSTTADGAISPTERMRIDSAGRVGIGGTPFAGVAFRIQKTLTGAATAYAQYIDSAIQTDVTSAFLINTGPTQIAGGVLSDLTHMYVEQGALSGTVTTQYGFRTSSTLTGATNNYGFYGGLAAGTGRYNLYMGGTAPNYMAGSLGIGNGANPYDKVLIGGTLPSGSTVSRALEVTVTCPSASTGEISGFLTQLTTQATSFNCANMRHFVAVQNTLGAGSTVSNQYGIQIDSSLTGATNNYGFYGGIASGTGRYNLYMGGTADNYLASNLGIGANAGNVGGLTGYVSMNVAVNMGGSTNATGVWQKGQLQSTVTNAGYGYRNSLSTAAATFTVPAYHHYYASQSTLGAGSTVAVQYGFYASSSLTGASVNIGFSGHISAGTGRYNLSMSGDADNLLNGPLGIGTAAPADASAMLEIKSTTKGVRMPNMTTTQKNAIASPAAGLMVFDTNLAKLCVYSGAAWQTITSI